MYNLKINLKENRHIHMDFFYVTMQIAEDMRPSPLAIKVLTMLTNVLPTWKLTPTQDIVDLAFRDPQVRKEVNFLFIYLFCRD